MNKIETKSLKLITDQFGALVFFRATISAGRMFFSIKKKDLDEVLVNLAKLHHPKAWKENKAIADELRRAKTILRYERVGV